MAENEIRTEDSYEKQGFKIKKAKTAELKNTFQANFDEVSIPSPDKNKEKSIPVVNKELETKKETKPSNEVKEASISDLKPNLQESLKKIQGSVKKEEIDKLLNRDKHDDLSLFESKDNSISSEHQRSIVKELSKWEASKEINTANAAVVVSWMENFGKSK